MRCIDKRAFELTLSWFLDNLGLAWLRFIYLFKFIIITLRSIIRFKWNINICSFCHTASSTSAAKEANAAESVSARSAEYNTLLPPTCVMENEPANCCATGGKDGNEEYQKVDLEPGNWLKWSWSYMQSDLDLTCRQISEFMRMVYKAMCFRAGEMIAVSVILLICQDRFLMKSANYWSGCWAGLFFGWS